METKKSTIEVRKEIYNEMNRIPKWINTTSSLHFEVWNLMGDCNDMLLLLINDKIITDKRINIIMIKFGFNITSLLDVLIEDDRIKLCVYFTAMLDMIKEVCLEEERYEACSNIQRFYDSYFTNLDTKDDEG
jgi:hypothetical protein